MPQLTAEQLAKLPRMTPSEEWGSPLPGGRATVTSHAGREGTRSASEVKARWRDIVEEANAYGEVIITNHGRPEVVVVSIDQYAKLKAEARANDPLTRLRAEFDRELAVLRTAGSSRKLRQIFASTPEAIATAASSSRRKR
jgi:prevent-host-death family protein